MHQQERKQGMQKLLPSEVRFIRDMAESGAMSRRELARKFSMNVESISRVVRGDTYPEVGSTRDEGLAEYRKSAEEVLAAETAEERAERFERLRKVATERTRTVEIAELALSGDFKGALAGLTEQEIAEGAATFADRADAAVIAGLPKAPPVEGV